MLITKEFTSISTNTGDTDFQEVKIIISAGVIILECSFSGCYIEAVGVTFINCAFMGDRFSNLVENTFIDCVYV